MHEVLVKILTAYPLNIARDPATKWTEAAMIH